MGDINVKIWFRKFGIVSSNEGVGDDEPFIWVFYYRVDGRVLLDPVATVQLPLHAPPAAHLNIQGGTVDVTPYEGRIEPGSVGPGSFVGLTVVFLEEDETADDTIGDAWKGAVAEAQRQGDATLRTAIKEGKLTTFKPDREAFKDAIFSSVFGDMLLTAVSGLFTPFGLGSLLDPDDFVGVGSRQLSVGELIANNHQDIEFRIEGTGEGEGKYYVDCSARRTDTDEVPIFAAMRTGSKSIKVLARNIDDVLSQYRSDDSGATFEGVGPFRERIFGSGPAACSSADGAHRHVVGLSNGDLFFHTRSEEKGENYAAFEALGEREFKSSPAVACSADGRWVHVVGRGKDDRYWHRVSDNYGRRWSVWSPIREALFRSTPTVVVTPNGKRVVVCGLRHDSQLWQTTSGDHGEHWTHYEAIPVMKGYRLDEPMHRCTSAPAAAVVSSDGQGIDLVCRGVDRTFHHTMSWDGGLTWDGRWSHLAPPAPAKSMTFASAPAIVLVGLEAVYIGMGDDLMLWRCISTGGTWEEPWDPKLDWSPLLRGEPPLGMRPFYY